MVTINKNREEVDEVCINTIRFLAVDAVERAASGHPGMPMGDAAMAYVLWTRFLRHNPKNPLWPARDRFVLSAGHGSMLLYSLLHLTGYDLSLDELKNFRQWGSHTPGHPEYDPKRGVETTTGPLGQGFANGVGMAMAAKYLSDRYGGLFDYNVYAITSDGDMMEGISNEAASLAGHLKLGSIVYLYSDNSITIEGRTDLTFTEDVAERFKALEWHVQTVDGNDIEAVSDAIEAAKGEASKPSLIVAKTNIGFGSPGKQDTEAVHGAPLGSDESKKTKEQLNWPVDKEFFIPDEVLSVFREAIKEGEAAEKQWRESLDAYSKEHPNDYKELNTLLSGNFCEGWRESMPKFIAEDGPMATRSASGKVLNAIGSRCPFLIGGSADLAPSNNTHMDGLGDFDRSNSGQNVHYGVREHAMGAVANGIAASNMLLPFTGTFLVFSDYMRPAIRLASLSKFHTIYVFTHDSIGLGEDGPTHQPIEHLASLRAMPGLIVIRPADANEVVEAWKAAIERKGPSAIVLTRQKVSIIDRSKYAGSEEGLSRGAYVLADAEDAAPELIIIATGSEVEIALGAYEKLKASGVKARVVSMPSMELFEEQDEQYKRSVLPDGVKARVSVEAGVTFGWERYVGSQGAAIGIDRFGASAPYKVIYENLGLTIDKVVNTAVKLLGR